jgi:beta propeller repeat protein
VSTQAPPSSFAASGSLVAWSLVTMAPPLIVCRVADDGSCAFDIVAFQSLEHTGFAVSGDRVVWSAPGPGGDPDVYFCEHDRHTGACPVQRLHGSPANQLDPEIAGDRIVWEDDRDGPVAVFGLELPSLAPLADRRTRVGRRLRITVRGHEPTGEPLALTAAFADGTPLSERGAHFRQHRNGTGVLHWRASAEQVGEHVVTFAGTGAGGLVTRRSVKIEVRPQRGH